MHVRDYDNNTDDFLTLQKWINTEKIYRYWCAGTFSYPISREEIGAFINDAENRHAFFAVEGETVFGFFILQTVEDRNSVLLRMVVIDNSIRGKGYGSSLLKLAEDTTFQKLHRESIELDVFQENEKALRCYERNGFSIQEDVNADIEINGVVWPRYHMIKINE